MEEETSKELRPSDSDRTLDDAFHILSDPSLLEVLPCLDRLHHIYAVHLQALHGPKASSHNPKAGLLLLPGSLSSLSDSRHHRLYLNVD